MEDRIAVRVVPRIGELDAQQWDACAGREDPFLSYDFLDALEESESAVAEEGWLPQHLAIEDEGRIVACAPLYVKGHSYGEYVFDWSWANAYERAGQRYYPKLQSCVPFTPVGGKRLLVHPDADREKLEGVLLGAMAELTAKLEVSSLHLTFLDKQQWTRCGEMGLLQRVGVQYHWQNRGYDSYDDFLGELLGRKRKALRKERREAQASGVTLHPLTGDDLQPEH
ncbi:MAG: peptidogalycan biosysnthesis protein, partial [Myxococcota bacterium]